MSRHDLAGRLRRVERELAPTDDWNVWMPDVDRDDVVCHATTGEEAHPDSIRGRAGRHILVEYVDGADWRGP